MTTLNDAILDWVVRERGDRLDRLAKFAAKVPRFDRDLFTFFIHKSVEPHLVWEFCDAHGYSVSDFYYRSHPKRARWALSEMLTLEVERRVRLLQEASSGKPPVVAT